MPSDHDHECLYMQGQGGVGCYCVRPMTDAERDLLEWIEERSDEPCFYCFAGGDMHVEGCLVAAVIRERREP